MRCAFCGRSQCIGTIPRHHSIFGGGGGWDNWIATPEGSDRFVRLLVCKWPCLPLHMLEHLWFWLMILMMEFHLMCFWGRRESGITNRISWIWYDDFVIQNLLNECEIIAYRTRNGCQEFLWFRNYSSEGIKSTYIRFKLFNIIHEWALYSSHTLNC